MAGLENSGTSQEENKINIKLQTNIIRMKSTENIKSKENAARQDEYKKKAVCGGRSHILARPEILAPAGTYKALEAAVKAGADAVYLAGRMFGARAYAGNFSDEELLKAIDYCHLFGAKVYLTVNTLLKENEIAQLPEFMEPFYKAGLDAVIVQDMGAASVLKKHFPNLALHASTQMSITSRSGADFLKKLGFTRIVPARELSLDELRNIKQNSDIEIETFVQGAMCFAYSGKCLMSSFLGGRSGNRGRCAQPCRKLYEIARDSSGACENFCLEKSIYKEKNSAQGEVCLNKKNRTSVARYSNIKKENRKVGLDISGENRSIHSEEECGRKNVKINGYLMSLKDMCTLDILPLLVDAGIDSFKIEGRMKNEYYVAACVRAYRNALDMYENLKRENGDACWEKLPEKTQKKYRKTAEFYTAELADIYNRGGFCSGYYFYGAGNQESTSSCALGEKVSKKHSVASGKKPATMLSGCKPSHMGVWVGKVERINKADIFIRLEKDMNSQDVVEIRQEGLDNKSEKSSVELTVGCSGKSGAVVGIKGKDIKKIKPGMAVYRIRNNALLQEIEKDVLLMERKLEASAVITAEIGKPIKIRISNESAEIEVEGKVVETAQNRPTESMQLIEKMNKTGGTGVALKTECRISENAFVDMSSFNELRRNAVEAFKREITDRYKR